MSDGVTNSVTQFNDIHDTFNNDKIDPDYLSKYQEVMRFVTYGIGVLTLGKVFCFND